MPQLAICGDWHANTQFAVSTLRAINYSDPQVDTIFHLGDFGYRFERDYTDAVSHALCEYGMTLYFIDGNHDNHEYLAQLDKTHDGMGVVADRIYHVPRGHTWRKDRLTVLAMGGAYSIDKMYRTQGVSWWPQEVIAYSEVRRALEGPELSYDMLFSHDAPIEAPVKRSSAYKDDPFTRTNQEYLQMLVGYMDIKTVVHGHWHQRYNAVISGVHYIGLDCDVMSWKYNTMFVDTVTKDITFPS